MNSKDFLTQNFGNQPTKFPKAYENMKKPKIKVPDINFELEKDQAGHISYDTSIFPPPLSSTSCFINETKNTDPNILRSTMYVLPDNSSTFDSLNIPLGIVLTPFSHRVNFNEMDHQEAIRCFQCMSYANNMTKIDGNVFFCNICKAKNTTKYHIDSSAYFLKHPTIEYYDNEDNPTLNTTGFTIDSEYFHHRLIKKPVFIFVVDVSSSTLLENVIEGIKEILIDETFKYYYEKACIVKVSNTISIVKCNNGDVSEVEIMSCDSSPFLAPDVFFDTLKSEEIIKYLETIVEEKKEVNLEKVFDIIYSLSKYSIGSKTALFTNTPSSKNLEEYTSKYIASSNSLYIFTEKNLGFEKLAVLTNGSVFNYTYDKLFKIKTDLLNISTTKSVFGVHIEVKTSDEIRKNAIYANTLVDSLAYIEMPQMDNNSTIGYTFYMDDVGSMKDPIYFQFVLTYYSHQGIKKVLLLNFEFKTSNRILDVYSNISFDTLFCSFAKFIASDMKEVVENTKKVDEMICRFLKYYRKHCCKDISNTQFVLPESAKLIPLLYQSLLKNKSFSTKTDYIELRRVVNLTVEQNLRYFYPRLFTLTDYYMEQNITRVKTQKLSQSVLDTSEIYVLENSQKIYLYIGKDVDETLKDALFNNAEENKILMNMVEEICGNYGYELPVVVVEEGKGVHEAEFFGYFVEDTLNGVSTYSDFICELHFKVQKY